MHYLADLGQWVALYVAPEECERVNTRYLRAVLKRHRALLLEYERALRERP